MGARDTTIVVIALGLGMTGILAPVRAAAGTGGRAEVRRDRVELRSDLRQVRRLETLLARLDDAHRRFDEPAERVTRRQIHAFLTREVADQRRQVARDRRELKRSSRTGERRDFQDDARDLATSQGRLRRQRAIMYELKALRRGVLHSNREAESRERELFQQFLVIARRDAAATGRELGEDLQVLRRDRRAREYR